MEVIIMNIKSLAERVLNVSFDFEITEIPHEGVCVKYDGKSATVGGCSEPALARAYMLLAMELEKGKKEINIEQFANFDTCGVMLDVSFGSVMKPESVKKYMDYMALHGMNMLMLYSEDTYEVEEYPLMGYQRGRYSIKELQDIDDYAYELGIEVIPCIQTFGHMRQFLKYNVHSAMAENDAVLLPGEEKTYEFIEACIKAVRKAFRTNRIHIGCDETRGLGFGKTYIRDGFRDKFEIFNEHLNRVVEICAKYDYKPMMWSDMYFALAGRGGGGYRNAEVPQYAIDAMPDAGMVFWNYYNTGNDFYEIGIRKHSKFNRETIFAGGIWTWNGQLPNIRYTYDTVKPAMEECIKGGVKFVFGTSWAYGDINSMLGLPCLAVYSEYCWQGIDVTKEQVYDVTEFITKVPYELCEAISDFYCGFEGDFNIGKLVLWSDPLVNLLCYDYDFPMIQKKFEDALTVMEKYPDAPYIEYDKIVMKCALHKVKLHQTLRANYKAGNRDWLRDYADNELPVIIADFEKLYEIHDENWHEDLKTHGFEKLAVFYAGAIERLKYTRKQINKYLAGEISEIEALEPEVLAGSKQKHLQAARAMFTY